MPNRGPGKSHRWALFYNGLAFNFQVFPVLGVSAFFVVFEVFAFFVLV